MTAFVRKEDLGVGADPADKEKEKTRDRTVFRRFEREARGRVGERDILGEKQVAGRSRSRIGDPVGSTGSQRLFRSGVPTIGGELGSSGVSRVAPFVKEAPPSCSRSGQMSNPVGNRLPFYICARARTYTHVRVVFALAFSPIYRIAILVSIDPRSRSLSASLSFLPNVLNAISRDFSKREPVYRVFYSSLRNRRLFRNTRRSRREEEPTRCSANGKREKKRKRNAEEISVSS